MTRREERMRMRMDGRNPYGSRGGYVVSSRGRRGRRGDRGMPDYNYEEDMRMRGMPPYPQDYGQPDYRGYENGARDMHYPMQQGGGETYYPVEAMGHFRGYYGMGDYGDDYRRGDMRRGDMRRVDYTNNDYADYGDYGDYGETLSDEELDEFCKKLKSNFDEREKQMFSKEMINQKIRQMGKPMENFGEKELEVATLMAYTDYKDTIGQNLDFAIKLGYDWLADKDVAVKGAEKLAVYYDCIVEGK